jgi:ATP-dependent DNA helicase RecG
LHLKHCVCLFLLQTSAIHFDASILSSPIEYLKGVGPLKGDLLKKELNIFTFKDLLEHFPLRHLDRTKVFKIADLSPYSEYTQVAGTIADVQLLGENRGKRLVAKFKDETGELDLVWFQGISWIQKNIKVGGQWLVYGKVGFFNGMPQITHPELETLGTSNVEGKSFLEPIYPSTEKLKAKGLGGKQIGKLTYGLLSALKESDMPENLPAFLLEKIKIPGRFQSYQQVHFPASEKHYQFAIKVRRTFYCSVKIRTC